MSDTTIRDLEHALETIEREVRAEVRRMGRYMDPLAAGLERDAQIRWRKITGKARLSRGVPAELATLVARVMATPLSELCPEAAERRAAADERARAAIAAEEARFVAAVARAPRALGWVDMDEALERAQGTAVARVLRSTDLREIVEIAHQDGRATAAASSDVAKSYKYPVSYTTATARRTPAGDVLLEITRTQTWGSRADTGASVLVPADLITREESAS